VMAAAAEKEAAGDTVIHLEVGQPSTPAPKSALAAAHAALDADRIGYVAALGIPALRERREDIPALVEHFGRDAALRHGARMKQFEPEALSALGRYAWPGNIRELRNVVEGAVLMATGEAVTVSDLPPDITASLEEARAQASAPASPPTVVDLEAAERAAISAAIVACQGNLTLVAKELRISKSTLYLKVKKYGLDKLVPDARVGAR